MYNLYISVICLSSQHPNSLELSSTCTSWLYQKPFIIYKTLLCYRLRSPNVLKTPIASLVPTPFRKPNKLFIGNPIYCSCFSLNSFGQNLKYDLWRMWYQTNSPIVLAFCCVCLLFLSARSHLAIPQLHISIGISLSIPPLPSRQGTSAFLPRYHQLLPPFHSLVLCPL